MDFYNANYSTQTITNANNNGNGTHIGTVSLRHGVKYTISSIYDTGYEIDHWTTGSNGTLGKRLVQALMQEVYDSLAPVL